MKFIGGEDMSDAERDRLVDAERQQRRIRYALRPRRELIVHITGWRRRYGIAAPDPDPIAQPEVTSTDLAAIIVDLEDQRAAQVQQEEATR